MRPEQHHVIVSLASVIPGDEGIGDAVVTQVQCRAIGRVVELALREWQAGIFHHRQVRARRRGKIERDGDVSYGGVGAGRDGHIRG